MQVGSRPLQLSSVTRHLIHPELVELSLSLNPTTPQTPLQRILGRHTQGRVQERA